MDIAWEEALPALAEARATAIAVQPCPVAASTISDVDQTMQPKHVKDCHHNLSTRRIM